MTSEEATTNDPIRVQAANTTNERKRKTTQGQEAANNNDCAEEAPAKPAKKAKVTVKNARGQTAPKHPAHHDHPIAREASAKQTQTSLQAPKATGAVEDATGASGLPINLKRRSQYQESDNEGPVQKSMKVKAPPVVAVGRGRPQALRRTGM
jgi:hypothetical protein